MNLDAGTARRIIIVFLIGGMLWAYFAPFIPPTGPEKSAWGPGPVVSFIPEITPGNHSWTCYLPGEAAKCERDNALAKGQPTWPAHWSVDFSDDQTQQFIGVFLSRMSVILMLCSIAWILTTRRKPQG
jgi:hypothetical protein